MRIYNIAIGGIHIESSTFSSYRSGYNDFKILEKEDLLNSYQFLNDYKNIKFKGLIHARALPGGIVSRVFFDDFLNRFLKYLKENLHDLDGLLLDIHGAMSVEGLKDAEGYLIKKIRKISKNKLIISTTTDLHGNISNKLFKLTDLITCYKTAPHIDVLETKRRALDNLILLLEKGKNDLVKVKVNVPILLPGEKTSTLIEPGKSIYKSLDDITNKKGIIDASIWMGFPWADEKRSMAVVIVSGFEEKLVINETKKLANNFWKRRNEFEFIAKTLPVKESVKTSLVSKLKPFFISDTGDNPGAGGLGDLTLMLEEYLKYNSDKKILIASISDTLTVEDLTKKNLVINLGNKTDNNYGKPLNLKVNILKEFSLERAGKCFLINYKNIDIIVTEKRFQYGKISYFEKSLINELSSYDVVVVKMGYLEPELDFVKKDWVMALSDGAVNQDFLSLTYKNLQKPLFPFDIEGFKTNLKLIFKKG